MHTNQCVRFERGGSSSGSLMTLGLCQFHQSYKCFLLISWWKSLRFLTLISQQVQPLHLCLSCPSSRCDYQLQFFITEHPHEMQNQDYNYNSEHQWLSLKSCQSKKFLGICRNFQEFLWMFENYKSLRQLEIDLFRLQSPLFSPRCKAFGKQTSLISPASRVS